MSGEVPTLEFQQRKSRWRNSAHSQTVPCADSTFHGAHCSGALSSPSVAQEITVKLLSCNLEGPTVASSPLASSLPWLQVCYFCPMPLEQKASNR